MDTIYALHLNLAAFEREIEETEPDYLGRLWELDCAKTLRDRYESQADYLEAFEKSTLELN